jgi:hypothetical protein
MTSTGRFNRSLVGVGLTAAILSGCAAQSQGQSSIPPAAQAAPPAKIRTAASSATEWSVSGRNIELNGKPFFIKGVDYGNTQIDGVADPNPVDNVNEPIWQPDLKKMRQSGVNAVKVYNVTLTSFKPYEEIIGGYNKLRPYETGKINKFLNAAWNNGNKPVYVVLSVFFGGDNVNEPQYLNALKAVYKLMATQYAGFLRRFSGGNGRLDRFRNQQRDLDPSTRVVERPQPNRQTNGRRFQRGRRAENHDDYYGG